MMCSATSHAYLTLAHESTPDFSEVLMMRINMKRLKAYFSPSRYKPSGNACKVAADGHIGKPNLDNDAFFRNHLQNPEKTRTQAVDMKIAWISILNANPWVASLTT